MPETGPTGSSLGWAGREVKALQRLYALVQHRVEREADLESTHTNRQGEIEREFENRGKEAIESHDRDKRKLEEHYRSERSAAKQTHKKNYRTTSEQYDEARRQAIFRCEEALEKSEKRLSETRWEAQTVREAAEEDAKAEHREREWEVKTGLEKLDGIQTEAAHYLDSLKLGGADEADAGEISNETPFERFRATLERSEAALKELQSLKLPRYLRGRGMTVAFVLPWAVGSAAVGIPLALFSQLGWPVALFGGATAAGLITFGAYLLAYSVSSMRVRRAHQPLIDSVAQGEGLATPCRDHAERTLQERIDRAETQYHSEVGDAEASFKTLKQTEETKRDQTLAEADQFYPPQLEKIDNGYHAQVVQFDKEQPLKLAEVNERLESVSQEILSWYEVEKQKVESTYQNGWNELAEHWHRGLEAFDEEISEIQHLTDQAAPDWESETWSSWTAPNTIPAAIPFGAFSVSLSEIPSGIPQDSRLTPRLATDWTFPALADFPESASVLFKAFDDGRHQAVRTMQSIMLRLLTQIPPSKVKFTIIDPVGLGENFAGFMHLADFDESLVTKRIWTEPQHIEQRLTDVTEHMENVIQKYLRNEFETLEEYNKHAGEVAEPYRFLVIANYPVNFTDDATRRLLSIAASGARCGVYTLVAVDTKQRLPRDGDLQDLERRSVNLAWDGTRFVSEHEMFARYPLTLADPPGAEFLTEKLLTVGALAKEASRVEVPFEIVAPPQDQWWNGDSSRGLSVPLGRSGATRLQSMDLGRGTSQHVLIAGKTGSGKSTLLHALITNTALLYGPDQVELYLVDFKKGVEFKTYASHELPHARVVAVESEREFGLSVLQRLDAELRQRGDSFRDAGVQDLDSYRRVNGAHPCPRILLIVDEFQEFFVEDDKIAQEASLLLDRLVRQGRAFGIHINLGSQTLGGAYSLARSTLSQMAVRIALQCSEADAHLILSDDNSAARLLSRPGEAIYNDANGTVEGNNFFQVVWLADEHREQYLKKIRMLSAEREHSVRPQIVFEGNAPSDLEKNHLLEALICSDQWPDRTGMYRCWLGEAVAIKDPTVAEFREQSGNNLLIVGQHDDAALGIMISALFCFALQRQPSDQGPLFAIFDGSPPDAATGEILHQVADSLPHECRIVRRKKVGECLNDFYREMKKREASEQEGLPPWFLFVYNVGRFRDLRKGEDDFGFSGFSSSEEEKGPSPAKQFGELLREGPDLGVFVVVWSDSVNNLNRTFERQTLREFELRVLFQMSAGDSSMLIDTPLAGKLGRHRALFYSEETGQVEKFRPYGIPGGEWLSRVSAKLASRIESVKAN